MLREESLEEITDGKRYGLNDMVRADAGGCRGCSKCCETMADTIILNPQDLMRLSHRLGYTFDELLGKGYVKVDLKDGVILPVIGTSATGACAFLKEGRCGIYERRPDICRLFPLGRLYEGDSFSYVLQTGQCDRPRSKVKVSKWLGIKDEEKDSAFILKWHNVLKTARGAAYADEATHRVMAMKLLEDFYRKPYEVEEKFYDEFELRAEEFLKRFT